MNNQVAIQIVNNLDSCSKKFGYNFQVNDFSNIDEILIEISEEPLLEKWNFNIFSMVPFILIEVNLIDNSFRLILKFKLFSIFFLSSVLLIGLYGIYCSLKTPNYIGVFPISYILIYTFYRYLISIRDIKLFKNILTEDLINKLKMVSKFK